MILVRHDWRMVRNPLRVGFLIGPDLQRTRCWRCDELWVGYWEGLVLRAEHEGMVRAAWSTSGFLRQMNALIRQAPLCSLVLTFPEGTLG